ncbi:MAG: hypothetical protein ACTSUH_10285 [Candidatus Thorarchaeota archaeon]
MGSNPVPVYLSAATLRPSSSILVHTHQTRKIAKRLRSVLNGLGIDSRLVSIEDATDPQACHRIMSREMARGWLDYTGGTKVMAVHVHQAWKNRGGDASRASYVDGEAGVIRFDDGHTVKIDAHIDLNLLARLHGLSVIRDRHPDRRSYKDLDSRASSFLGSRESKGSDAEGGYWLEEWVASLIDRMGIVDRRDIHVQPKLAPPHGSSMELDVVVTRGYQTYVISCTITRTYTVCKLKAFEVILRGRQVGGDHVRTALAAPLDVVRGGREGQGLLDQEANLEGTV